MISLQNSSSHDKMDIVSVGFDGTSEGNELTCASVLRERCLHGRDTSPSGGSELGHPLLNVAISYGPGPAALITIYSIVTSSLQAASSPYDAA